MAFTGGVASGSTIAWTYSGTPSAFSAETQSIGAFNPMVPAIDTTLVSTTQWQRKKPGTVMTHEGIPVVMLFDGSKLGDAYTGASGSRLVGKPATATITYAKSHSVGAAGSWTGSGFFTQFPTPELSTNALMVVNAEWHFDGITGPTFTAEAVA